MTTDSGHEAGRENFPVPTTRRLPYKLYEAAIRYVSTSSVFWSNWEAADVNLVEVGISEKDVPHEATASDSASLADAGDVRHVDRLEDLLCEACGNTNSPLVSAFLRNCHTDTYSKKTPSRGPAQPLSLKVFINGIEINISARYWKTTEISNTHCETIRYITLKYAQVINLLYIYYI